MSKKTDEIKLQQWHKRFFEINQQEQDKNIEYYHVNTSVINDLYPIDVGHEKHSANDLEIPNKYPYFSMHFVIKGKGYINVDGVTHTFSKNDLFVLPPNTDLLYATDKKSPWEYYWINFNGLLAQKILDNLSIFGDNLSVKMPNTSVKQYFIKALAAKKKLQSQAYTATECLFGIFSKVSETVSLHDTEKNNKLSMFEQIYNYTRLHLYDSDLTAKSVSQKFFIDPCYFSTLFKKNANTSFKQFVNYERIKKATLLIETTDMLIKEIAETVGFTDPLHFSKLFKKYRLVSPEAYRLAKRSGQAENKPNTNT